ncbi:ubiquitinyl hydrolase 1 [Malassezia psittaci]|uniref:ubiquitinyl hydrolase 1 n=1 Tax=Malassezia psittaci TaxID=1821823 RepID=A0AAF0JM16_9BASI|nr:ubiquitinyl hydrolase 1 [Malassezia psittaci]
MTSALGLNQGNSASSKSESDAKGRSLISDVEPLDSLVHEYQNNRSFLGKVKWLKQKSDFQGLRRLKGDGNCFYRALGFAYVYTILTMEDRPLHHFANQHLESTLELLKQSKYDEEVVKDFYEPLQELMSDMYSTDPTKTPLTVDQLVKTFNDPEKSNSIVVYLRMVTSAFLKSNANDYTPFLISASDEGDSPSMEDFCNREVEAFGKDADHLQITALCTALKVSLDVVYLSRSHAPPDTDPLSEDVTAASEMPENEELTNENDPNACDIVRFDTEQGHMFNLGHLLYRPGHFDLLVAKPEPNSPEVSL